MPNIYDVVDQLVKLYPELSRQTLYDIVLTPWQTVRKGVAGKLFVNMYYPNLGTFFYTDRGLNLMRQQLERKLFGFIDRRDSGKHKRMSRKALDDFLERTISGYIGVVVLLYCYEQSNGYKKRFRGVDWTDIYANAARVEELFCISLASWKSEKYDSLQKIFMRDVLQKEIFDKLSGNTTVPPVRDL